MARRPIRPTYRCLRECLLERLTDPALRRSIERGDPVDVSTPLHSLPHDLLESAIDYYGGRDEPPVEMRLQEIQDRPWYRHKNQDERGAIWFDDNGQGWLGFVGPRRDDSPQNDAYKVFERACAKGSDTFLPTSADKARLEAELLYEAASGRQEATRSAAVSALVIAARTGETTEATLPDGAAVRVTFGNGDPGEIFLSIEVAGADEGRYWDELLPDVLGAIPGIARDEWSNVPAAADHNVPIWYALVDEDWIARLLRAGDALGDHLVDNPDAVVEEHDGKAHVTRSVVLAEAYVEGRLVRALCGRRFIPTRDPEQFPMCEICTALIDAIDRAFE